MEKISYQGWQNCYRLKNEYIEVIITADVGPRIIHLSYLGEENFLKTYPAQFGQTGSDEFRLYGGHRLWHAPEHEVRTYYPDNDPVEAELLADGSARFTTPIESTTGIQKSIDIVLHPTKPQVSLTHRFKNHNMWTVETALWALTVMDKGGTAIAPLPPRKSHDGNMLPSASLTLWSYTNMADERWKWGNEFIMLHQMADADAQKIGLLNSDGWLAYARDNKLFVKTFDYEENVIYPDFGVNCELFTDSEMLELETLSPLRKIEPQATAEHRETWHFGRDIGAPQTDAEIRQNIIPILQAMKS